MHFEELQKAINEVILPKIPDKIKKDLSDVEMLIFPTVEEATKLFAEQFKESNVTPIANDCKGIFFGSPMEEQESSKGEDEEEVDVYLPEGMIILIANNLANAGEAELVIYHEIGHALGMDEDEVAAIGLGTTNDSTSKLPETIEPAKPE